MSALSHRRPLTVRAALLAMLVAAAVVALAGYVYASASPQAHEFVAFVQAGTLNRGPIAEKGDLLEAVNGLSAASEIAGQLGSSPWTVWRRYSVTAEGTVYVVRVHDADQQRGARLVQAARDALAASLKLRYEAAMAPHRAYVTALEAEVGRLAEETAKLAAAPANNGAASGNAVDRRVALAEVRHKLRDAQMFAALSEPPGAVDDVHHRSPDRRARQLRLALTGAVLGLAAAAAVLVVLALHARSSRTGAGA